MLLLNDDGPLRDLILPKKKDLVDFNDFVASIDTSSDEKSESDFDSDF